MLLLVQGEPAPPRATVEGVVLRAGTNQPLPGARGSLEPLVTPRDGSKTPEFLETGVDGRFILKDVLPDMLAGFPLTTTSKRDRPRDPR